ncbi:MAG: cytochrome c [Acidobacteriia bacterium]|nr:cytochrome c [Terriglobia bacterium]
MSFCRLLTAALCAAVLCRAADQPSKESVDRGQKLFVQSCGFCHGNDATGSRAPDLIRSTSVNHDENGNTVGPIIRSGRPDKGMPGFPLSDAQIADIAAFLHSRVLAALNSASVEGDYPLQKLLTGNAAAGKAFFEGAGGCTGCHSSTGDFAGIGGKYQPIVLQSRILYPGGARSSVTVTPPSGKHVTGTLVHIDEFIVALRDDSGWYHSWPRAQVEAKVSDPLEAHRKLLYVYTDANIHDLFAYLEGLK